MDMDKETKKIKNLKISVESHEILKKYCDKRGIKIYKFIENLIFETCKEKKIYMVKIKLRWQQTLN